MKSDQKLVIINVRITATQAAALASARRQGFSASWIARAAINEKLATMKKQGKIE